jgi:hypothetical protein
LSPDDRTCPPSQDDKVLCHEIAHKLKLTKGQRELLELIYHGLKQGRSPNGGGPSPIPFLRTSADCSTRSASFSNRSDGGMTNTLENEERE